MTKAVFLDFYGTVVHEDGEVIQKITQIIHETGDMEEPKKIGAFWWKEFQEMCDKAYGDAFETQRTLEERSLRNAILWFHSSADAEELSAQMFAHWQEPPIFQDTKEFLEQCSIPVYFVSNTDNEDIEAAMRLHGLTAAGIFTSEDARSYKPRKELFERALNTVGVRPEEVVHIGDSLSSDVKGASQLGIRTIWLNRSGKEVPEGVRAAGSLTEVLEIIQTV